MAHKSGKQPYGQSMGAHISMGHKQRDREYKCGIREAKGGVPRGDNENGLQSVMDR